MTKDLNPQQYKQMMNYLTRPKKKPVMNNYIYDGSKNAIRSKHEIREDEIKKDPNMLCRIKYYVETYDNVSLGEDFDKAILVEDENIKKARGQTILQRGKKLDGLKKRIDNAKAYNTTPKKPFNKIKKPVIDLVKIDPTPAVPPKMVVTEPSEEERRFKQMVEDNKKQKELEERSGIGGLLLTWRNLS